MRRTNYYQNNGFDNEQSWDYDNDYPPQQNGYLNHQWTDHNGYHHPRQYDRRDDEVFEDHHHTLEQERFHDDKPEASQVEQRQDIKEDFEESKSLSGWDDKFEEFKNGPFPKK